MSEKVIIIGGTAGIGEQMVRQLAQEGAQIAVFGRSKDALIQLSAEFPNQIFCHQHDVTESFEAETILADTCRELGGLDTFIYCSGVMYFNQPPAPLNTDQDVHTMMVNLVGAVKWLDCVANRFASSGGGSIVVIGSVAGERARLNNPGYGASKAGLHAYSEGLRFRFWDKGVKVSTVKPGPVTTRMTAGVPFPMKISAEEAARKILLVRHKPGNHFLSFPQRVIFTLFKVMPEFVMKRFKK